MKLLSIVILTYNSENYIQNCLDSIFEYNDIGDKLEVIVVDNSDSEISRRMFDILSLKYENKLILIKSNFNGGYGYGNNIGIDKATSEIILIMNPDVVLTESIFKSSLNHFKKNTNLSILGLKQIGGCNLSYYFKPEYYYPVLNSLLIKIFNKIDFFHKKYMFLSGALLFINKNKFIDMGLFDSNLFLYFEESDITNRALNKKFDIIFDKEHKYFHDLNEIISDNSSRAHFKSLVYYFEKYNLKLNKYFFYRKVDIILTSIVGKKTKRNEVKVEYDLINEYIANCE